MGLTVVAAEVVVGLVVVVVGGAVVLVTAVVLVVAVVVVVVVVDGAAVVVVLGRTAQVKQENNHINSTLDFMISRKLKAKFQSKILASFLERSNRKKHQPRT